MNYEEALQECVRREAQRKAENSTEFEVPMDEIRKASRPGLHLDHWHTDGIPRWIDTYLIEGDPLHPRRQQKLDAAPVLTDAERMESDWTVDTYDAMDF